MPLRQPALERPDIRGHRVFLNEADIFGHLLPVGQGMQGIVLKYFLKGIQGALESHHAETGEGFVFVKVDLERGEQLPGLDQGVVLNLEIRASAGNI